MAWPAWAPWVLHLVIFSSYMLYFNNEHVESFLSVGLNGESPRKQFPDIYNNLEYKTQRQTLGSMTDNTPFRGRPSVKNADAWEDLLDIGIIGITPDEAAKLPLHTAPTANNPDEYIVELNVFHQLHCLHMLRNQIWEPKHINWKDGEDVSFWELHMDHCVEHLRQGIMCNADMTPLRFLFDHEQNAYTMPSRQEFICKDFDAIRDWATIRNSTGLNPMKVGGEDKKDSVDMA